MAQQLGIVGIRQSYDAIPSAGRKIQLSLNTGGHFMCFQRRDMAPRDTVHPQQRLIGCIKDILRRRECIDQTFGKEISDSRNAFKAEPWQKVIHCSQY